MKKIINIFVDNNKVPSENDDRIYKWEICRNFKDFKEKVDQVFNDSDCSIRAVSFGFDLGRSEKNTVACLHYLCKVYVKHYIEMPTIIVHSKRKHVINAFKMKIEEFEDKMCEFVELMHQGKRYLI